MKVVIAIDSFKNCLTSMEAGKAIEEGIYRVYKKNNIDILLKPLADGGEGTVEALVTGMNGEFRSVTVYGPLMKKVEAIYGYLKKTNTAIIEMAAASGLGLIKREERNPFITTTYGVGEIIKTAMKEGIRNFVIGIGGSATNDAGLGMLKALGYKFYNKNDEEVGEGGRALKDIVRIEDSYVDKDLEKCKFNIACDVTNPLCGENGASYVYGPQKGASKEMVEQLDNNLYHFANIVSEKYDLDNRDVKGSGAAGGLGFAFLTFLNGELKSGIDLILQEINLEKDVIGADYLITGEGRLDFQTAMGKAPIGVAKLAKKHGVKVIALAGAITDDAKECNKNGIDAYFSINNRVMSLEKALEKNMAKSNLSNTTEQIFRLIDISYSGENE